MLCSMDSQNPHVLYFTDPMCSWCWGFAPVIQQIRDGMAEQLPVRVVAGGLRAGETRGMNAAMRATILHHWREVHKATGQPFKFDDALPDGFIYNTEPACRALVTARELEPASTLHFLHHLHDAFYAQGRDITDAQILAAVAESTGVERERFLNAFSSDDMQQTVKADFELKERHGVMGFPTLMLWTGQRYRILTIGWQPAEPLLENIRRLLGKA